MRKCQSADLKFGTIIKLNFNNSNHVRKVLRFLPVQGNALQAKFSGPNKVLEKFRPVDYRISTPGCRKIERICNVNLLSPYIRCKDDQPPNLVSDNVKPVQFVFGSV